MESWGEQLSRVSPGKGGGCRHLYGCFSARLIFNQTWCSSGTLAAAEAQRWDSHSGTSYIGAGMQGL